MIDGGHQRPDRGDVLVPEVQVRSGSSCPIDEEGDGVLFVQRLDDEELLTVEAEPLPAGGQQTGRSCGSEATSRAVASTTCSQLSSTWRVSRRPSAPSASDTVAEVDDRPAAVHQAGRTASSVSIVARGTSTVSLNWAATASARLVLPTPPGPTRVTTRDDPSNSVIRFTSSARPNRAGDAGR